MSRSVALPTYVRGKVESAVVPVQYSEAVRALAACQTIDDAKLYSDKADALAAWAKIYKHDQAGIEAKRLKLHAYRRMGDLARELRPWGSGSPSGGGGTRPGAVALLKETGLRQHQANAAVAVSKTPKKAFEAAVNSAKPPAPARLMPKLTKASTSWRLITSLNSGTPVLRFRNFCRKHNPRDLALGLTESEATKAREIAVELIEWLDEFEHCLPRGGK